MDTLFEEWSAFLKLLTRHRVRFLLIGGHAVSLHARPRHTEDLDLFVDATKANGARVLAALADFGFASVAPPLELLSRPQKVFMLGRRPYRIDLLTKIDGVSFKEAWADRVVVELAGLAIPVIGKSALKRNKLASGRPKDLADLALLEEVARAPRGSIRSAPPAQRAKRVRR